MSKPLGERIRDWDDYVEDHDREQAVKPFDAGVMLAIAKLFDAWDANLPHPEQVDPGLLQAMKDLRSTVEQVIE